jgi:hypothetical protein
MLQHGQANLLEIVLALAAARRFASSLHGRQKQRDEDTDDRNDDEQFDKSEAR